MSRSEPQPLPLAGLRILAVEQMQAMPFGTQLLARMGADVVKVDVEGHEGSVLAGMARTLAANPGVTVILEHSPAQARLAGLDPAAPLHQLAEAGLRHAYLVREGGAVLEGVGAGQWGSRSTKTGRSINLVVRAQPWPADAAVRAVVAACCQAHVGTPGALAPSRGQEAAWN